ncbi:MAG TPA: tetratricopeptide repeat protein [Sphingobacteriaceae bacterium]
MKTGILYNFKGFILFTGVLVTASCGSQKDTVTSRGMQNLTARYNILYNARIMLEESERNILASYQDNYDRLIPVYREPSEALSQPENKNLDKVIEKVNVVVNEKAQSQYVDDAYFLIAKANHLKAQYFNASEFFDYLYKNYPEEKEKRQAALAWKARALIALDRFEEAGITLDTAFKYLDTDRRSAADLYATRAQLHIYAKEDKQAISLLERAVRATDNKQSAIRWSYLLGQLQELNGNKQAAYQFYTSVVKSNAPFGMAFSARLNRIGLEDEMSENGPAHRIQKLLNLLKDDKNREFIDQIYREIGNTYAHQGDYEKAREAYETAARRSINNPEQKGFAYLDLAELYLSEGRYEKSKSYFDSALRVLPKEYPGYSAVDKKASNLDILADRLSIISREDTLQMLARLPENEREERITQLTKGRSAEPSGTTGSPASTGMPFATTSVQAQPPADGKFYFNNRLALSQGFSDFKKRWGNRKLEDNWRRSLKSSTEAISNANQTHPGQDAGKITSSGTSVKTMEDLRQSFLKDIPLTKAQFVASDKKIASAYFDLGNFYKDILDDDQQAIESYEELLRRFPGTDHKLPVYYNLYRLYQEKDPDKAGEYKAILLNKYPDSPFSKSILDPNYSQRANEQELALTRSYEEVYSNYLNKEYNTVKSAVSALQQEYGHNKFSAQVAYLGALATGHTQKLEAFEQALKALITTYPDDQLITPLAQQHMSYINANREAMSHRDFALVGYDRHEQPFVEEPEPQIVSAAAPQKAKPDEAQTQDPIVADAVEPAVQSPDADNPGALANTSGFSQNDSTRYYFVVNVSDPRINLSSSRFGIGQFNRANYRPNAIKHQLKALNNQNQLIFVGLFGSREEVTRYAEQIMPLMKQIMKIPAEKYSTFIITGENLGKVNDGEALEKYIEYYQNTY